MREKKNTHRVHSRSTVWVGLGLLLLVIFAYLPVLNGEFLNIDDTHYLVKNRQITETATPFHFWAKAPDNDYWWPVTYTFLWVLWHFSNGSAIAFHLINALLHALNAFIFFLILRQYQFKWAALAAVLFVLHPLHVPAVAWIFQHKTVLSASLFLAAYFFYQKADGPSIGSGSRMKLTGLAIFCFALSVLAKSSAIMLPFALLFHHWWSNNLKLKIALKRIWPFALIAAGSAALTLASNRSFEINGKMPDIPWDPSFLERFLTANQNLWFYVIKLLAPINCCFVYPLTSADPGSILSYVPLAGTLIGIGALIFMIRIFPAAKAPAICLLFFAINLIPVLGFVSTLYMRYSLVADHYAYLPSLGVVSLAAAGLFHIVNRWMKPAVGYGLLGLLSAVLLAATVSRASAFKSSITIWQDTIRRNPTSDLALYNLGTYYFEKGKAKEAESLYRKALAVNPSKTEARINLGKIELESGRLEEAEREYRRAIALEPDKASAHYGLGVVLQNERRDAEALSAFSRAIALNPKSADAWSNKCLIFIGQKDWANAESSCRKALSISDTHYAALTNLGAVFLRQNRFENALGVYRKLVEQSPRNSKAWLTLGQIEEILKNKSAACRAFGRALDLSPDNRKAEQHFKLLECQSSP